MGSRRIVLVDDSPEFLRSAEHFLSAAAGFEVVGRASSGKEALRQVDRLRPDLVLMDVAMPGMNGLEAARQIKSDTAAPQVVLVTMHDSPEYRAAAAAAGADGFLPKAEFGAGLLPLLKSLFEAAPVEPRTENGSNPKAERNKAKASILVVQNRLTERRFLTTLLRSAGYDLLEANDAAKALKIVQSERPDVVISSILMPERDGFELVRDIRRDPAVAATPVIFYAASYHPDDAFRLAQSCGVQHVLSKHSVPAAILDAIENSLRRPPAPAAPLADADFHAAHLRLVNETLCNKAVELEAANLRLAAMVELAQQLSQETDPNRLLDNFCHTARHILGARYALIGLRHEDGQAAQPFRTSGLDPEMAAQLGPENAGPGLLRRLLSERLMPAPLDRQAGPAALSEAPERTAARVSLVAAISSGTQVYGWLYLVDKLAGEFCPEDERLARTLCGQAAVAYENARRSEELARWSAEMEREAAEHRRSQAALQASEEHFRQFAENLTGVFWIADVGLRNFIYVSPGYEKIWGRSCQSLYERPSSLLDAVHPDDRSRVGVARDRAAARDFAEEFRIVLPDGSIRWIWDRGFPVRNADGQVYRVAGIAEDITVRKHLEEQLRQAQKMEAVGRLAAGVAHDFNNVLTIFRGYPELLLNGLEKDDARREILEVIKKSAERAAGLTRQLLALSRKQVLASKVLDLNAIVNDMNKMLRHLIGEDIDLVTMLDGSLFRVKADPGQLEQVFLNLAVNARDAMPQGGKLVLKTTNVLVSVFDAAVHRDVPPGEYAMASVTDAGCGMDADVQAHLFEPFYTTKDRGMGTGLGLATVYGIVKQSGGHINCISALGQGTTFRIYLPRSREEDEPVSSKSAFFRARRGSETVLVAEDDDALRPLVRTILLRSGYQVLEARNGGQALRLCQQHSGPIHLMVTDVIMPEMNGRQLADRIAAIRPETKVLFMSGYTDGIVYRNGVLEPGTTFMQKPFSPSELARKVREVLDEA